MTIPDNPPTYLRFAYADPPYPGQAKRHYRKHPDYAGEVDHRELVARLADYDGWALSTAMRSLPSVLALCPPDVLTLAWIKPMSPPLGDHRIYSWEPVIMRPARAPSPGYVTTHLVASPPSAMYGGAGPGHVIGEKPARFARWLFAAAGLRPGDTFEDLFPGSGAVGREWDAFARQGVLAL